MMKMTLEIFLEYLSLEKGICVGSGINRKLHSFKAEVDQIFLRCQNIVELARIGTYFDDSIEYKKKEDIANYCVKENAVIVNFNMNPYELNEVRYPHFISVVLGYIDKIDIGRYLDFNDAAEFSFELINLLNSLKRIFVEFKCSDSNKILEIFELQVGNGENKLRVPLKRIQSKALREISEICFVIHPDDVIEEEGMFRISEIKVY